MTTEQECANCLMYQPMPGTADYGRCRAHPPVVFIVGDGADQSHPVVARDAWCGEWSDASSTGLTVSAVEAWLLGSPYAAPLRQLLHSRGVTSDDLRTVMGS